MEHLLGAWIVLLRRASLVLLIACATAALTPAAALGEVLLDEKSEREPLLIGFEGGSVLDAPLHYLEALGSIRAPSSNLDVSLILFPDAARGLDALARGDIDAFATRTVSSFLASLPAGSGPQDFTIMANLVSRAPYDLISRVRNDGLSSDVAYYDASVGREAERPRLVFERPLSKRTLAISTEDTGLDAFLLKANRSGVALPVREEPVGDSFARMLSVAFGETDHAFVLHEIGFLMQDNIKAVVPGVRQVAMVEPPMYPEFPISILVSSPEDPVAAQILSGEFLELYSKAVHGLMRNPEDEEMLHSLRRRNPLPQEFVAPVLRHYLKKGVFDSPGDIRCDLLAEYYSLPVVETAQSFVQDRPHFRVSSCARPG